MLTITSELEGKRAFYGDVRTIFEKEGFSLCGGWEYYYAYFDAILMQKEGVTIYLRLPAHVIQGKLDHEDACLQFGCPFLIKHVVHTGLTDEPFKTLDIVGLNQFQAPLDPDDGIVNETKWRQAGEEVLHRFKSKAQDHLQ